MYKIFSKTTIYDMRGSASLRFIKTIDLLWRGLVIEDIKYYMLGESCPAVFEKEELKALEHLPEINSFGLVKSFGNLVFTGARLAGKFYNLIKDVEQISPRFEHTELRLYSLSPEQKALVEKSSKAIYRSLFLNTFDSVLDDILSGACVNDEIIYEPSWYDINYTMCLG